MNLTPPSRGTQVRKGLQLHHTLVSKSNCLNPGLSSRCWNLWKIPRFDVLQVLEEERCECELKMKSSEWQAGMDKHYCKDPSMSHHQPVAVKR